MKFTKNGYIILFIILFTLFALFLNYTKVIEGISSTCKPGCVAPTVPTGSCKVSPDGSQLKCPWECSTDPSNYNSTNCTYNSECASCVPSRVFDNNITLSTACFSSKFGCCPGGNTSKIDNDGSNCSSYKETNTRELTAACFSSEFGCCPNGITASVDTAGSNCSASGIGSNPWDNNSGSYSGSSGYSGYSRSNLGSSGYSGYSRSNSGSSGYSGYSRSNSGFSPAKEVTNSGNPEPTQNIPDFNDFISLCKSAINPP